MKATIACVLLLALVASFGWASEVEPIFTSTAAAIVPATVNAGTVEVIVPVSSYVENRHELTTEDWAYLATVPGYDGLRERVRELMVAGIHHRPACGHWTSGDGAAIDQMYQVWTGPYQARVRIPLPRIETVYVEKPLPPLGELYPRYTEPVRLQRVEVDFIPVGIAAAPCAQQPRQQPRSLEFGRQGSSEEHPVAGAFVAWEQEQSCNRPPTTCPPDQHVPYEPAPEAPAPSPPCPSDPCP